MRAGGDDEEKKSRVARGLSEFEGDVKSMNVLHMTSHSDHYFIRENEKKKQKTAKKSTYWRNG